MNLLSWPSHARPNHLAAFPRFATFQHGYLSASRLQVRRTETGWELSASVPGLDVENVKIEASADRLTVTVSQKYVAPEGFTLVHRERVPAEFTESFQFRAPINMEAVEATARDGVLLIKVPRLAAPTSRIVPVIQ
jgi:HSP20 family protein